MVKVLVIFGSIFFIGSSPLFSFSELDDFENAEVITSDSTNPNDGPIEEDDTDPKDFPSPITEVLRIDWIMYDSVQQIVNASSHIITGKVISTQKDDRDMLPVLSYEIQVLDSIKGNLTNNDVIIQKQIGKISNNDSFQINDKIMDSDEEYLFYLVYNSEKSYYTSIGGPQGRFPIMDSKVYSLDIVEEKLSWLPVKANSVKVEDYKNSILDIIKDEEMK